MVFRVKMFNVKRFFKSSLAESYDLKNRFTQKKNSVSI